MIKSIISSATLRLNFNYILKYSSEFKTNQINSIKRTKKPQDYFTDKIDNSKIPFVPKIRYKPNAIVPLPEIFKKLDEIEINEALFKQHPELLVNPYLIEIEANKLNSSEPKHTGETVSTTNLNEEFEYVDTLKALNKLKNELSCRDRIKEIAVDLEHHNMRSYQGYTCLLQISTRYKDYVIDAIKLRSNINILNEIFTDSTLLKVFHSPFCDVKWLQKDFGIYLVNIFDTSAAGFLLKKRQFALKEFIELYFNVKINKNYTMADWSVRPLKMGMIDYARNDTHYLLSIYDNLRSELVNKTLFKVCQDNSNEICKKVYVKPTFDLKASRHRLKNKSYSKSISLSHRQIKAIDLLSEWRDNLARELDESCEYVLKNEVLFKIGKVMPKNRKELFELLVNLYDESIVQIRENEILQLVLRARNF